MSHLPVDPPASLLRLLTQVVSLDYIEAESPWGSSSTRRRVRNGLLEPALVGQWGSRRLYWWPKVLAIIEAERRNDFDLEDTGEI